MKDIRTFPQSDARDLIERIRGFRKEKNFAEAEAVGEAALKKHSSDADLLAEHAETAVRRKNWGAATKRLRRLLGLPGPVDVHDAAVLKLSAVYVGLGQPAEAQSVLDGVLADRPESLVLRKAEAELALLDSSTRFDSGHWRELAAMPELRSAEPSIRISTVGACVAGLRLAGLTGKASDVLGANFRAGDPLWEELFPDGYARLVVFDNGRTRVEFHTKLFDPATSAIVRPGRLAITFDVMEATWDKPPFAYRPLSSTATDFLGVRKRSRDDFHQEFRRGDFLEFAGPIAAAYGNVVALGQSLGGYSALYYASWLPGCRVLATAPRNPLHPKYAGKRYASHKLFVHEYDMPVNTASSPTIVYDPRNKEDGNYVERSLAKRFPHATFVSYPYCGHSITRYLSDLGTLKAATLGFCNGKPFPSFDKARRGESSEYLRNLARVNLQAGRRDRARRLARKALELDKGREPGRSEELLSKIDPVGVPEA